MKHFCYSAGWKKFEKAWDLVIRIKQLAQMRPVLEAVLAPVGSWVDTPLNQPVDFAGVPRDRGEFLTWQQVREVAQSGLVEIAAHTDALHKGVLANPQGNMEPAAATRRYDPVTRSYEPEAQFQARMRADVAAISNKIRTVTGKAPKVRLTGTLAQTGTKEEISIDVPVEIQAGGKKMPRWLRTGSEPRSASE